jgi:hypothetical protein
MTDQWQIVEVTGIGHGELWFEVVEADLSKRDAQRRAARGEEEHIAIPMDEVPDDWGDQWLNGELEDDPYA